MKKIITSLLSLSLLGVSCTKDPEQPAPQTEKPTHEAGFEIMPNPYSLEVN